MGQMAHDYANVERGISMSDETDIEHGCVQTERLGKLDSKFSILWRRLDDFLTIKIFALFMTFFTGVAMAGFGFVYSSNVKTFDVVMATKYEIVQLRVRTEREREIMRLKLKADRAEAVIKAYKFKTSRQKATQSESYEVSP